MSIDRRSLTLRLTLLFGVASTLVLVLIGVGFYLALHAHFLHEDAIELRGKTELLGNLIGRVQSDEDLQSLPGRLQDALVGHRNLFVRLLARDGRVLYSNADASTIPDNAQDSIQAGDKVEGLRIESVEQGGSQFRVTRFTLPTGYPGLPKIRGMLAMNVDHHQTFMAHIRDTIALSVMLGALTACLLSWFAARAGIAPLRAFSTITSRISAAHLDDRIAVKDLPPELAQLGQSFNAMLSRLEDSFRRLSDFSSDLAHELRTPVSALMTQAHVALSRSRSAGEYREVIYSALEEYDRLARMTTDMLFLARADHGLLVPAREPVDLRGEVLALFDFYDALVESKGVRLAVTGSGMFTGDRIMLRRALSNLFSNAIRHAVGGSTVTIDIAAATSGVSLSVTNEGSFIPAEHLPRVFDRFYRVDAARQRSTDGAGLGLSITKSIIVAHGGTIGARSAEGRTSFDVNLPAQCSGFATRVA